MLSINEKKNVLFVHIHKTGGTFINSSLKSKYGFTDIVINYPIKQQFVKDDDTYVEYDTRILPNAMRKMGILPGYRIIGDRYGVIIDKNITSIKDKWDTYYKFAFIRNPYDRLTSAWEFIKKYNIDKLNFAINKNEELFKEAMRILNYSFYDFICNRKTLPDYEYLHAFLLQSTSLKNTKGLINFDFIGKFENLNEDFIKVLKNIGFDDINHENKIINKTENKKSFVEYYTKEILHLVNEIFNEDFELLGFTKCNNMEDLRLLSVANK